MITVSIVSVTSYTALELLRLLSQHSEFVVTSVTARSAVGKRLSEVFPQLDAAASINPRLVITEEPEQTDLSFVCLPHTTATEAVVKLLQRRMKVVDMSADFRLHDANVYEEWYKHVHLAPSLLETAVYGLCERYRECIGEAALIANPGCNATAAILALLPAVASGIISSDIIIDVKAALSGAGRSLALHTHYAEANEDVSPYSLTGHRHLPEIIQELEAAAVDGECPLESPLRITFVPHLVPMTRGILVTCYANIRQNGAGQAISSTEIQEVYERYYDGEPFVHIVDQAPHTKWTYGSNHCFIHPFVDVRTQRLIVVACLDNMGKGAASQAIQNANRLYGLPETTGLYSIGINP